MKIEKLPSGSFRIRKMYRGQSYSVVFDHKPTQKEVMQSISAELEKEHVRSAHITFETAAGRYIQSKANIISPSTEREYLGTIKRLSDKFKLLPICDITRQDIQKEVNRLSENLAPKTVRNYHGFISAVLKDYRPDLNISTTLPQKQKKDVYIPSDKDVKPILEYAKGSMFEIPLLLACYGLRRSEICALTIDDLEENTLHITKAMVQDKNKQWVIKSTKTTAGTRDVIIPPSLADMIRAQGYIYNGKPNSIRAYLTRTQDKLGIEHFSFHKLRHYFASKMSALNIPEVDIITMGGWETDHVMKTVYRHSLEEDKRKSQQRASDKLAEILLS